MTQNNFNFNPPRPGNPSACTLSHCSIGVTWDGVTGAVHYNVYRSKKETGPYELIQRVKEEKFIDTGLQPRTTYYYKIAACTERFIGAPAGPVYTTTYQAFPPCSPGSYCGFSRKN